MNEKLSEELLSQKLMKLQRNSRRGLVLFLLGFIGVVCTLIGWLFGQGEGNKLPILLFTAVLLAGIAKARDDMGRADRRAGNVGDRIFLPGRSNPLPLRDGSAELLFLQHIRDTAHHFVIGRHRRARAGAALSAELLRIPGVGKATARLLWDHFKALDAIIAATPAQLAAIPGIGPRKAEALAGSLKRLKE